MLCWWFCAPNETSMSGRVVVRQVRWQHVHDHEPNEFFMTAFWSHMYEFTFSRTYCRRGNNNFLFLFPHLPQGKVEVPFQYIHRNVSFPQNSLLGQGRKESHMLSYIRRDTQKRDGHLFCIRAYSCQDGTNQFVVTTSCVGYFEVCRMDRHRGYRTEIGTIEKHV